jgi:hypothetical protein
MFVGRFDAETLTLDEIQNLTELNGGVIVKRAKDFGDATIRIVVFDEKNKTIDRLTTNKMLTDARIHTLTVAWLLDSLACYKLFEFESYALYG